MVWQSVLVLLSFVTTFSLVGIVAVWAATGRGHWFVRHAALLLFVGAWLLVADDRLALLFLAQSTVVVIRVWFLNRRAPSEQDGDRRRHFSLGDLLLAILLLGGALGIFSHLRAGGNLHLLQDILPGVVLGGFTIVAFGADQIQRPAWLRAAILLLVFPSLVMGAWLWLAHRARGPVGRLVVALGLVLIAVLPARVYYRGVQRRLATYPAPLADNGFDELVRAADLIDAASVDVEKLSDDELRAYLTRHRPTLDRLKAALDRPSQAVLPDNMNDGWLVAEGQRFKGLADVLAAQGRLEAKAGRPLEAAQTHLDIITLGAGVAHGGVFGHDGWGARIEEVGVEGLLTVIAQLDDAACREVGARLAAIDSAREPLEIVMSRENLYLKRAYPWKYRLIEFGATNFNDDIWRAVAALKRARLRLLVSHLALRRAWLAANQYPEKLQDLLPSYLTEVPHDPFSEEPLVYRKLPNGYRLYSIGVDRADDGGTPMPPFRAYPFPTGDVVIDPAPAPTLSSSAKAAP